MTAVELSAAPTPTKAATVALLIIATTVVDARKNANTAGSTANSRREVFGCMVHPSIRGNYSI